MSDKRRELAALRQHQLDRLRQATGQPERMTLGFACAKVDRLFNVTFARMPPARQFTCEAVEKAGRPSLFGGAKPAGFLRVPADQVNLQGLACPWCAASNSWTRCSGCGAFVCGARSKATHFRCRASCGSEGSIGALDDVTGAKPGSAARTAIGHAVTKLLK